MKPKISEDYKVLALTWDAHWMTKIKISFNAIEQAIWTKLSRGAVVEY